MNLSTEDKAYLLELLQSPGWKTLTTKVWPAQEHTATTRLRQTEKDHRYYQGFLDGFGMARDLAETCCKSAKDAAIQYGTVISGTTNLKFL